jgi:hypothetical protein
MTKPNWYAEKWTDDENTELADSKNNGAAASRITRAGFYINYCGGDFKGLGVRTKNSSGSWEDTAKLAQFTEKFPFFQPISGDGFCGLHSGIVGTLAKCVDNPYHFKQFKDNLTKWPDNLPADKKAKAQATINKVLAKIPQENLSYQEFYDLVNHSSNTDNISKQLSVALYMNADLSSFEEDIDTQNSAKNSGINNVNFITAGAVTHILGPISPFGIIALNNDTYSIDKILDEELEENSVYIVGYGGHFDLLHSKLDYNLDEEIAKIELEAAKAAGANTTEKNTALTAASQRKRESKIIEVYKNKVDDIWKRLIIADQRTLEILGFGKYEKTEDSSTDFLSSLTSEGAALFPKLLNTRTMVEDAIKRITYNNPKTEGHQKLIIKSTTHTEKVSSTFQSIKARNKPTFAYTDREIDAANCARNIEAGIKYFKNSKGQESGILLQKNGKPLTGSNGVQTIIEMPACAVDQGSPISLYLATQLEHLEDFTKTSPNPYPVKILFPYKLQSWHWNVGEVTVTQEAEKLVLEGCAYDSMNKAAGLESKIQKEILDTFEASFPGQISTQNHLDKKSASPQAPQKGGIACGLYAGLAMHNLKTKTADKVWDEALRDESILRDEDSELVSNYNPKSNFCAPLNEIGFVDIFKTAAPSKASAPKKTGPTIQQQIAALKPKPTYTELQEGASLLEAFVLQEAQGKKPSSENLSNDLKDNPLKEIIFIKGSNEYKTKPIDQLSNLAFEAILTASAELKTLNTEEKAYQDCIEVISGSYADYVSKWAISSPSLTESLAKITATTTDPLTEEEESLKDLYAELKTYIETKKLSPENQKDLLGIALSARKMICAEVELARSSSIAKMQKGMLEMLENPKGTDKSAILLVEQFSKSNNPILEKGTKSYTPLEAAKEKITAAKQKLNKAIEEKIKAIEEKIKDGKKITAAEQELIKAGEIKVDGSEEAKHISKEEDFIINLSAKGILSKALRANAIEEREKTASDKKVSSITFATKITEVYAEAPDRSENLEIQFGKRYVRKEFVGNATTKLKFENENFGDNSFANCTFTNCDFTENSGKRLNFVNCTFGEGCVLPENLRNKDNNFVGCKFNEKIFEVMTNADELKTKLGIQTDAVAKDGFYQSEKPSSSISYGTAFKLNLQMLNSLTTTK